MTGPSTRGGTDRPPTLDTVAARAGVSRSTVSRVINESLHVTAEARDAVLRAVAELDYIPNRSARSLALQRSDSIALVVPTAEAGRFPVPYFASIVQGVSDAAARLGCAVRIVSSSAGALPSRGMLLAEGWSGAVVIACDSSDAHYAALDSTIPIMFVGRPKADGAYHVSPENEQGAADAARHLIHRGRRRVALLAGPETVSGAVERLAGWRGVLQEHGMDTSLLAYGDLTVDSGADAMAALIDLDADLDAVLVANDQMAAGAYSTIFARGLRIPEDISVIGFDNDDYFGAAATPALTSVDQRSAELGSTALRALMDRLAGRPVPRDIRLRTQLLIRDST